MVIPEKPWAAVGVRLADRGSGRVPTVAERQGARRGNPDLGAACLGADLAACDLAADIVL